MPAHPLLCPSRQCLLPASRDRWRFPSLPYHTSLLLPPHLIPPGLTHPCVAFVVLNYMFPSLWLGLRTQCHPCSEGISALFFTSISLPFSSPDLLLWAPIYLKHILCCVGGVFLNSPEDPNWHLFYFNVNLTVLSLCFKIYFLMPSLLKLTFL